MKISGYVVWVNDKSFWHRTQEGARKRVFKAGLQGQDVFIHPLDRGAGSPKPREAEGAQSGLAGFSKR